MKRRLFIAGAVALIVSPAIVRAESLMKIAVPKVAFDPEVLQESIYTYRLLTVEEIGKVIFMQWKRRKQHTMFEPNPAAQIMLPPDYNTIAQVC